MNIFKLSALIARDEYGRGKREGAKIAKPIAIALAVIAASYLIAVALHRTQCFAQHFHWF